MRAKTSICGDRHLSLAMASGSFVVFHEALPLDMATAPFHDNSVYVSTL